MTSRGRQHSQAGFTLVEVVLAVAVLALAMVTLGQTLGASAVAYRNIDDTRQAYLVAADKLVEMQVYQQWPNTGTNDDQVTRGDREWWVRTTISSGPPPLKPPASSENGTPSRPSSANWVQVSVLKPCSDSSALLRASKV